MSATYNLFKSPGTEEKEGKKAKLHARLVNQSTIRIDKLCEEISNMSSFSSSDVKGILEVFRKQIAFHLKYGEIVDLEGLGTFNVSLKCPSLTEEKQIVPHLVKFNKVVFRCSKEIKKDLRFMKVERADEPSRIKGLKEDSRKERILNYLATETTISTSECCYINGCSKYVALKDINTLLKEGRLFRLGRRSNAQYGLKPEAEEGAE